MGMLPPTKVRCICGKDLGVETITADDWGQSFTITVRPHTCLYLQAPPGGLETIDELVKDNKKILEDLHNKFLKWDDVEKHYTCDCPICSALERS